MIYALAICLGGLYPLSACVVSGTQGACYEQPSTLSGNCDCIVSEKFGTLVCRPKGVCDPLDPTSCSSQPGILAATQPGAIIDPRFLAVTADHDPVLAAALFGALDQERDAGGAVIHTRLTPGEHYGTLGTADRRSLKYWVNARQFAGDMFALSIRLEDEDSGEVQKFDGALYQGGIRGEIARLDGRKASVPVVVWDLGNKPERSGQAPSN
jgi:hypothetical protein